MANVGIHIIYIKLYVHIYNIIYLEWFGYIGHHKMAYWCRMREWPILMKPLTLTLSSHSHSPTDRGPAVPGARRASAVSRRRRNPRDPCPEVPKKKCCFSWMTLETFGIFWMVFAWCCMILARVWMILDGGCCFESEDFNRFEQRNWVSSQQQLSLEWGMPIAPPNMGIWEFPSQLKWRLHWWPWEL